MSVSNFIVVDADFSRANGLSRALSALGYAFPVTRLEEVGEAWPDECAIFVADHEGQLARAAPVLEREQHAVPRHAAERKQHCDQHPEEHERVEQPLERVEEEP